MKEKKFNIIDYITMRGDLSFEQSEFNCVDALILSQISYNNVEGLVSSGFTSKITLEQLANSFENDRDFEKRSNMGAMINTLTPVLLQKAGKSRRFGQVKVCGFINRIDYVNIEQFSALTYEIEKNSYVVAFRGTDDTIVGWYEDFNLGHMAEVPAQKDAVAYIKEAMDTLKGQFIVTGHSKGGNLSVKAGMSVEKKAQKRLQTVYNFDGPGFFKEVYQTPEFLQIKDKLKAFFPEFCIVGMMFEHSPSYSIVACDAEGILQHDPFTWNVTGPCFALAEKLDEASRIFYSSFNDWTQRLSAEERKRFVDTFFSVINASGVTTNYQIEQNMLGCGTKMLAKLAELKEEDRKAFMTAIKMLIKAAKDNIPMFNVFDPKELLAPKEVFKKLRI
ncbi:MAG: DUF2974 domain-containing protein [Treponema sp.]|nr:DUF2974 domain-containing protein [Treponema sp.]